MNTTDINPNLTDIAEYYNEMFLSGFQLHTETGVNCNSDDTLEYCNVFFTVPFSDELQALQTTVGLIYSNIHWMTEGMEAYKGDLFLDGANFAIKFNNFLIGKLSRMEMEMKIGKCGSSFAHSVGDCNSRPLGEHAGRSDWKTGVRVTMTDNCNGTFHVCLTFFVR